MADALVAAAGLGKVYGTGIKTRALEDVSFEIGAGEFIAIVGRSGSGKSTLLNLLGLLDTPSEGTLHLRGIESNSLDKRGRAKLRNGLLGFVFQYHHLLPEYSVRENVLMPYLISGGPVDAAIGTRVDETLEVLGLEGLGDKNANDLSGGQKQRVAIGRALMNRPAIVLADEPTGNLDTKNSNAVLHMLMRSNRELGQTTLMITHNPEAASVASRILYMRDGQIVREEKGSRSDEPPPLSPPFLLA